MDQLKLLLVSCSWSLTLNLQKQNELQHETIGSQWIKVVLSRTFLYSYLTYCS